MRNEELLLGNEPWMTALRYILQTVMSDPKVVNEILLHAEGAFLRESDLMEQDWLDKQRESEAAEFLRLNPTSDASFMRAAAEAGVVPVYERSVDVRSFGETEPF